MKGKNVPPALLAMCEKQNLTYVPDVGIYCNDTGALVLAEMFKDNNPSWLRFTLPEHAGVASLPHLDVPVLLAAWRGGRHGAPQWGRVAAFTHEKDSAEPDAPNSIPRADEKGVDLRGLVNEFRRNVTGGGEDEQ